MILDNCFPFFGGVFVFDKKKKQNREIKSRKFRYVNLKVFEDCFLDRKKKVRVVHSSVFHCWLGEAIL